MRISIPVLLVSVLAGCQTAGGASDGGDARYYLIPPGSRFVLNKEINIAPGQVGVYIQSGRILSQADVNRYYPFCKFDLRDVGEATRAVTPDEMFVIRSSQQEWSGGFADSGRTMLAQLSSLTQMDSGPSVMTFSTLMQLRSDKQPETFRMTCSMWGYPPEIRHVTIGEIRRTLGDIFTLHLP